MYACMHTFIDTPCKLPRLVRGRIIPFRLISNFHFVSFLIQFILVHSPSTPKVFLSQTDGRWPVRIQTRGVLKRYSFTAIPIIHLTSGFISAAVDAVPSVSPSIHPYLARRAPSEKIRFALIVHETCTCPTDIQNDIYVQYSTRR
jgi:hypothetical protein